MWGYLLIALKAPSFFSFLLGIYWLQKLLGHYQQGEFFGQQTMNCYIWLIWLKLVGIFLEGIETFAVAFYYEDVFGEAIVDLSLNINELTTILLMLVIVYLLKAAKEIEAENKEFV